MGFADLLGLDAEKEHPSAGKEPSLRRSIRRWSRRPRTDPYGGADLENAGRLAVGIWLVGAALGLALTPIFPPTVALGSVGWAIAGVNAAVGLAALAVLRGRLTFNRLYAIGYLALVQIALTEWLAGAREAPYDQLYLLVGGFVGGVHPPRRILVFFAALSLAAFAPLAYGGWDAAFAAQTLLQVGLVAIAIILVAALMSRVRAQRLSLQRDREFATKLARIDALTGLGNRRGFEETLRSRVVGAAETTKPLLMLVGDIDDFKRLNDRFGHLEGDRLLRQIGSAIADTVRQGDLAFRWGGDEFVVLLPDTDRTEAERIAGRLEQAVESLCRRPDGESVSLIWGVADFADGTTSSETFWRADQALLARKQRYTERESAA